jgi:glutamine synthetase
MQSMTTAKNVMKMIKDNDVKYVDFRFTDPRGKWQHVTFDVGMIEEDTFAEGQMFDGSSIAGWKAINESDMNLMPDPASACIDPFFAETTLVLVCDVLEPTTGEPYNRDPRGIAKKAEGLVKSMGVGDTIFFGPEAEFFVFDDVKYKADPYNTGFKLDSIEFRHRIRRRQSRPPRQHQERLLPGAAAGFGAGHALGNARRHGPHGRQGRETPPRSGVGPARARPEVLAADANGRHDAGL